MSEPFNEPVEPVAPAAAEPTEPAEPAEPAWAGPSQEEWAAQQQMLQYMAQAVFPGEQQPQREIDPYDPQQLAQLAREQAQQVLSEQASEAEADKEMWQIVDGYAKSEGDFLFEGSRERVADLAQSTFLAQTQRQYGFGPKAATEALHLAFLRVKDEETKIGEAYHQQQMAQLQGLAGVRREPAAAGQNGAASQLITAAGPGDEHSLLQKYFGR